MPVRTQRRRLTAHIAHLCVATVAALLWINLPAPVAAASMGSHVCGVPEHGACPPLSLTANPRDRLHSDDPQVLFINFDGVTLSDGDDDAPNNTSIWADLTGQWTSYPEWTPTLREEAREHVATIFAPFDVLVTTTRPGSGDYTMVVVGGHGDFSGGYSTSDCNNMNRNTVAFVGERPTGLADYNLIAHEAGHSFGLTHTETDVDEIMNPVVWDGSQLGVSCAPRSSDYCDEFLSLHCSLGSQNSHASLCEALGPWDAGETCELEAEPQPDPNDSGDDSAGESDSDSGDDPEGESGDDAGGETGDEGGGTTGGGGTAGDGDDASDGGDASNASNSGAGTGDSALPADFGTGDDAGGADDQGCGCTAASGESGWMTACVVLLLGMRRRRWGDRVYATFAKTK